MSDSPIDTGGTAPVLVLVTGSMRSGTSSLAGSLAGLGLHVPKPEVPALPRNPKGHFEPHWVILFHKRHLGAAKVRPSDSSPQAQARVDAVLEDGSVADELATWLAAQRQPRIVVKDPHAHWFLALWRDVAARTGRDLRMLTALRHPAEVVGSQERTWGHRRDDELRVLKETSNVAGWLNVALLTELGGRGAPRAFVGYTDLIGDWRGALGQVSDQLGLGLPIPGPGVAHDLDDFLDAGLRNSQLTFDDISVPDRLRALAAETWTALETLVDAPGDIGVQARLDRVRVDYDALFEESRGIALDDRQYAARIASQAKAARMRERITRLRERVAARDAVIGELERRLESTPVVRAKRLAGRAVRKFAR